MTPEKGFEAFESDIGAQNNFEKVLDTPEGVGHALGISKEQAHTEEIETMSAKTSHRRAQGTVKRGGRVEHIPLDMTAWVVADSNGIEHVVYTLGVLPQGHGKAVLRDA